MRPIVNVPREDRATDIDNVHKNLVKVARVVPEISSRKDGHTDTQTYSSQYFATAPAGEVKIGLHYAAKSEMPSQEQFCGVLPHRITQGAVQRLLKAKFHYAS